MDKGAGEEEVSDSGKNKSECPAMYRCSVTEALGQKDRTSSGGWHLPIPM